MIVSLLVLALIIVLILAVVRQPTIGRYTQQVQDRAQELIEQRRHKRNSEPVTVVQNGEAFQANAPVPRLKKKTAPVDTRNEFLTPRVLLLVALALLLLLSVAVLPRSFFAPRDQFLVLVAPFANSSGQVDAAGISAAQELVRELERTGSAAIVLSSAPANTSEAGQQITKQGADALVYGVIADGAVLDERSLTPMLVYRPNGIFAPTAWDGYVGRFAMPQAYALSAGPINGKVVVPLIIQALSRYSAGDADAAFNDFETLLRDYPELAQPLPRAIRGNILWAIGNYTAAADEYQRTGVLSVAANQPSEMALLANNLGAIWQDAGNPAAEQAFAQAAALLGTQQLPQLQLNLAHGALAQQRYDEVIVGLEPLSKQPVAVETLTTLIDGYLGLQRLDDAEAQLTQAEQAVRSEIQSTTAADRDVVERRLNTNIAERRVRLQLARAINSSDELFWELLTGNALTRDEIDGPRARLIDVLENTDVTAQAWREIAAAADVARQPYRAQVANGQARRAEDARYERRKLKAALDIDLARERGISEQTFDNVLAAFRGQGNINRELLAELSDLQQLQPNDAEAGVLRGFGQLESGDREGARQTFEQTNTLANNRPEPLFGLARAILPDDRARAKALLAEAISRDATFYPARTELAELAEADQEWQTALDQRRYLVQARGTTADKLALANTLQQSGSSGYAEAEQVLLPLANANDVPALLRISTLYRNAGDLDAAEAVLNRAQTAAPNDAEIAYQLGTVFVDLGRTEQARTQFEQAVKLEPNFPQARIQLGELYAASGNIEQAAQQYDAALRSGTRDSAALQEIGRVMLIAGEEERAQEAYKQAINLDPSNPAPHLGIAQVYVRQNKPQDAVREAEQALTLSGGTNPRATATLGDASLAFGDIAGAIGHYTLAAQQDPNLVEAKLGLGRAAAYSAEWTVAKGYFDQVIGIDPQSADAYYWKGESLLQEQNVEDARNAYQNALTLRPNYPEAYFGLAKTQAALGSFAEAHASIERALGLRRNYAEAHILDGLVYEQENNRVEARRAYDQAVNTNRQSAEAYYRRALLTIGEGDISSAQRDLEAAVRNRDNFPEAHYWLGRSYLANNRPAQANQQFEIALNQSPNRSYAEAQFYQGVAREQLGDRANAYAAYRSALDQAPGGAWAAEAQAAITRLGQ